MIVPFSVAVVSVDPMTAAPVIVLFVSVCDPVRVASVVGNVLVPEVRFLFVNVSTPASVASEAGNVFVPEVRSLFVSA